MDINFTLEVLEDNTIIEVRDYSKVYSNTAPTSINSMLIKVSSSKLPESPVTLDALAYVLSSRVDSEIYRIKPSDLGFSTEDTFPDGLYTFEYSINNTYYKTDSYALYYDILQRFNAVTEALNYEIDVVNNEARYRYDTSEGNTEMISICAALIEDLKLNSLANDEVAVNDVLDKLTRLLTILEDEI